MAMNTEIKIEIDTVKAEILELKASKARYWLQYESARDNEKTIFLELIAQVEKRETCRVEQIVLLQKSMMLERPPLPAQNSRPTSPFGLDDLIIARCRKFMLCSMMTEVSPGVFEDGQIKNCATVISSRFAAMAGHCVPKSFPKDNTFKVYSFNGQAYDVRLVLLRRFEDSGDDFALIEVQNGQFQHFPSTVSSPCQGAPYFIFGYDGEYPESDVSYFKGTVQNMNIYPSQNFIIGSPGTTSGCSGGGVFGTNGDLYGICVSGHLDSGYNSATLDSHLQTLCRKLGEPSYSHIVPGHYLIACCQLVKENASDEGEADDRPKDSDVPMELTPAAKEKREFFKICMIKLGEQIRTKLTASAPKKAKSVE